MPGDGDHGGFPGKREDFPDGRERSPLHWIPGCVHRYLIATTTRTQLSAWSPRRYPAWAAAAALLITVAGVIVTAVALLQTGAAPDGYRDGMLTTVSYALPYAVTGAFLIARRPDLPFGWLLSGAAVLAALGSGAASLAYLAVSHGASQRLALVGFAASGRALLPAAVEVAAFRIAVEAVNNAVRHSGAHNCQVRLEIGTPGRLLVDVRDDGAGAGPWQAGVGLLAMRERAAELGGTLTAGPGPDGGTVRACFPLPAKEPS